MVKSVKLHSNFFKLAITDRVVFMYDVEVVNERESKMPNNIKLQIFNVYNTTQAMVYDGNKIMYSLSKVKEALPLKIEVAFESQVYFVKIVKLVNEIKLNQKNRQSLNVLDVLFKYKPSILFTGIGRSFFNYNSSIDISKGVNVCNGFYQSIKETTSGLAVNIDTCTTCFYQSISLVEFCQKYLNSSSITSLNDRQIQQLSLELKNIQIKTTHSIKRKYRIHSLSNKTPDSVTFEHEGVSTNVLRYFKDVFNITLRFPNLPCVAIKKPDFFIHLPLEVCVILPNQRKIKVQDQITEVLKIATARPNERKRKIADGFSSLNYESNQNLQKYGVQVNKNMIQVDGYVLDPPKLLYSATVTPQPGQWNLQSKQFHTPGNLESWCVLSYGRDTKAVQGFVMNLMSACKALGMKLTQPDIIVKDPRKNTMNSDLKEAGDAAYKKSRARPQLILVVLADAKDGVRAKIKLAGECIHGVATQCVLFQKITRANVQYCANVALKMNAKIGGINNIVPEVTFLKQRRAMIIGADVTHPASGDMRSASIAALCASVDQYGFAYTSALRVLPPRVEVIPSLDSVFIELLTTFYQKNKFFPETLLFYRDGVAENQFDQVKKEELAMIYKAYAQVTQGKQPRVMFVIAQKRHHARFFPVDSKDADRNGNPIAGTVVNSGVVSPDYPNFYLYSHASIQGTSRPAHYTVLHNDLGMPLNVLEALTFQLTHMFARCTRSVSLVPAVYYAHLLAARGKCYKEREGRDIEAPEDYRKVLDGMKKVFYFV